MLIAASAYVKVTLVTGRCRNKNDKENSIPKKKKTHKTSNLLISSGEKSLHGKERYHLKIIVI